MPIFLPCRGDEDCSSWLDRMLCETPDLKDGQRNRQWNCTYPSPFSPALLWKLPTVSSLLCGVGVSYPVAKVALLQLLSVAGLSL